MTQADKLDNVLAILAKHHIEYERVYDFYFKEDEIKNELQILLGQIVKDGYATVKQINDPEVHESYGFKVEVHRITNEGLEYYRASSYKKKFSKEQKKKYWSLVEKVSIAVNAILLLIIAVGGLYVANSANEDREENRHLKHTIDSLRNVIDDGSKDTNQNTIPTMPVKTPQGRSL